MKDSFTAEENEAVFRRFKKTLRSLPLEERRRRTLAALLLVTAEELVPGVIHAYASVALEKQEP